MKAWVLAGTSFSMVIPMASSYTEKSIRITITIDNGAGAGTQCVFEGFATQVRVTKQGAPELPKASVRIYGLSEQRMAELTMLSFDALSLRRNAIEIAAGEAGNALSVIFQGEVTNSAPDFNAAPSPVMNIEAITAAYPKLIPASPVSVNGSQTAESLMTQFSEQAGMTFKNEGVTASVSNCVINGDPISKMEWVANSVGADLVMDDNQAVLVPRDAVRGELSAVAAINPQTGETGYPTFDSKGIQATCFFRPDLCVAGYCKIESALPRATGVWKIYSVTHDLTANCPGGGAWFTTIAGTWIDKA